MVAAPPTFVPEATFAGGFAAGFTGPLDAGFAAAFGGILQHVQGLIY